MPEYRHGHNVSVQKPAKPRHLCACGCGVLASPGKTYRSGHNRQTHSGATRLLLSEAKRGPRNPQFGKQAPNFQGWQRHTDGYITIHSPAHPMARNKRVMEHRLVLEADLVQSNPGSDLLIDIDGQMCLSPEIEVHHINGVKDDNRLENLQPLTKAEHARLHRHLHH